MFPSRRSLSLRSVSVLLAAGLLALPCAAFAQQLTGGGMLALPPVSKPSPAAAAPNPEGTSYHPAKLLRHPTLSYPTLALLNRVEGTVRVRFGIDDQGHVETVNAIKTGGSVLLDAVVLDHTLREWTFQPATLDGKPIASSLEQELEFRLDPEEQRRFARERLAAPIGLPDPPYPPEAVAAKLKGSCTIGIFWTPGGLPNLIYLAKSSGSNLLDHTALRFAFTHWHIDPKDVVYAKDKDGKDLAFTKTVAFNPPGGDPTATP